MAAPQPLLSYLRASGLPLRSYRTDPAAIVPPDGADVMPWVHADRRRHWIDHSAVQQLRADHAAAVASWRDLADSSPPPLEPDWSQAVRDKTPSPAALRGAEGDALAVDLLAAPEIVIDSIPPWSTLRITGPVGAEQSYDDGTDAERIRLYVPGQYRVALAASRHLTREWVINAT